MKLAKPLIYCPLSSSSVSAEQQLQPLLCYLLPAAGESERAPHPAAEPPVWVLEPETQEHLRLRRPRGERPSWVHPAQTSLDPTSAGSLNSRVPSLPGDHGVW